MSQPKFNLSAYTSVILDGMMWNGELEDHKDYTEETINLEVEDFLLRSLARKAPKTYLLADGEFANDLIHRAKKDPRNRNVSFEELIILDIDWIITPDGASPEEEQADILVGWKVVRKKVSGKNLKKSVFITTEETAVLPALTCGIKTVLYITDDAESMGVILSEEIKLFPGKVHFLSALNDIEL